MKIASATAESAKRTAESAKRTAESSKRTAESAKRMERFFFDGCQFSGTRARQFQNPPENKTASRAIRNSATPLERKLFRRDKAPRTWYTARRFSPTFHTRTFHAKTDTCNNPGTTPDTRQKRRNEGGAIMIKPDLLEDLIKNAPSSESIGRILFALVGRPVPNLDPMEKATVAVLAASCKRMEEKQEAQRESWRRNTQNYRKKHKNDDL